MPPFLWIGFNCLETTEPLEGDINFLPLSFQEFLVIIWLTLDRWKAESTLEPPSGFGLRTLEFWLLTVSVTERESPRLNSNAINGKCYYKKPIIFNLEHGFILKTSFISCLTSCLAGLHSPRMAGINLTDGSLVSRNWNVKYFVLF